MVDNSTWAGMIAMTLQMHIYCSHCDRHVEVDMSKFPPEGKAIGATFRCRDCGRPGATTVSHRSANRSYPGAKPVKEPYDSAGQ
ncbi:hypothetical protein G6L97_26730 (plasmid) [Agrobacterium tumefaciens]|uniref:hypothetical protein n=1 Tax=Agrobacterium tumefaciens TaxID=358 RepID=UPI0015738CA1|nr:hypothetical protein [Agrobacterium tumefaciens]NSZ87591.1 hypothetical protein [Agrobacterium tumefaciens]WCA72917.1 hypothetical protein G6L97_26730 [Agrobacterium tumefaciens]